MAVRIEHEDVQQHPLPLSNELFSQLRQDILQGILKDGEKLTEQRVCDLYGVSRTPVREAFRQLEREGLISTQPNRGAFITGLSPRDLSDLYELRQVCEVLAVRLAIQRRTPEGLEVLEEAFEFMEFYTMKQDPQKMFNVNMEFHRLIHEMTRNRMLIHILQSCQVYTKETRTNIAYLDGGLMEVLAEHRKIYDAFTAGDPEAGAQAMTVHLDNAKRRAGIGAG